MPVPPSSVAKTIGFALLGLSVLATGTALMLPFLQLPHKAAWVTAAVVAGELLFAASLVVLGKQYGKHLKQKLLIWLRRVFRRNRAFTNSK